MPPTVVILQNRLLHYRLSLFQRLRTDLLSHGVQLRVLHGTGSATDKTRADEADLDWTQQVNNRYLPGPGKNLIWQRLPRDIHGAQLVIVTQENRILSNYPLLVRRRLGGPLVAYWGHGKNFQSLSPSGLREKWKRFMLTRVDWWFAYTSVTVEHVVGAGFDASRITNLNNSIDVAAFQRQLASITHEQVLSARRALGIPSDARVGLFCGSIYPEKRIASLLESVRLIRETLPDFHLVVVGDGPSADEVRVAAATTPWLHYVGVAYDEDKALYHRLADIQLNPRLLGLNVLDAFAAGLPVVVARDCDHGPEIAYLLPGVNGLAAETERPPEFAAVVTGLLSDPATLESMRRNALQTAKEFSIEETANAFCEGILRCLSTCAPAAPERL